MSAAVPASAARERAGLPPAPPHALPGGAVGISLRAAPGKPAPAALAQRRAGACRESVP